jgi:predicted outer membrane repeat protein
MNNPRRITMNRLHLLPAIAIISLPSMLFAETILVPSDYNSIQAAIIASNNGDTVLVDNGIYNETINFLGKEITVKNASGTALGTIIDAGSSFGSVVTFNLGETSNTILEGFTIRNGSAGKGGGVLIENSSPVLKNCIVVGNHSTNNGGGIYVDSSDINLENVIVKNNSAKGSGAGIYLKFSNCVMTGGSVKDNSGNHGGAIYVKDSPSSGEFILNSVSIEGNTAVENGGGIYSKGSFLDVEECVFDSNASNRGGALFGYLGGNATIISSSFVNNSARDLGGAVDLRNESTVTFTNCEFKNNIADSDCDGVGDGAVLNTENSAPSTLQNPTICNNLVCDSDGDFSGVPPIIIGEIFECVIGIGACCGGAACWEMEEDNCADGGGTWSGDATVCASVTCESNNSFLGACCVTGYCIQATEHACVESGSDFHGTNVECIDIICVSCPEDINGDGEVGVLDIIQLISAWGVCP